MTNDEFMERVESFSQQADLSDNCSYCDDCLRVFCNNLFGSRKFKLCCFIISIKKTMEAYHDKTDID